MAVADHMGWARARVANALEQGPENRVVAVLVGSADLIATVEGRTAGLTSEADRALLRAWREAADVLLVGSRTLEAELYSGSIVSQEGRDLRKGRGLAPLPPILTIDRSRKLDLDKVLRGESPPPVTAYVGTGRAGSDTRVTWIELPVLSIAAVLDDARERSGARVIVFEGGPLLLQSALEANLVTDLSLTVAPYPSATGPPLFAPGKQPARSDLIPPESVDGYEFTHWTL
jgi:riboflavin biosynthesis pyrimidine reductase